MKFYCDSCNAKYLISDEKVAGKILKIKCKKCQHIMVVREPTQLVVPGAPPSGLGGEYAGPDYGLADEATVDAIRTLARCEGVLTDPVYEGKSLAGLIDLARRGHFRPGSRVLYVHLGGAPVLGAYSEEIS